MIKTTPHSTHYFRNFLKSVAAGLVGAAPGLIMGLGGCFLLFSFPFTAWDNSLFPAAEYVRARSIDTVLSLLRPHQGTIIAVLATGFLAALLCYYGLFLRIINSSFRVRRLGWRKAFRLLLEFFGSYFILFSLAGILRGLLSLVIPDPIATWLFLPVTAAALYIFVFYWHREGARGDLFESRRVRLFSRDFILGFRSSPVYNKWIYARILAIVLIESWISAIAIGQAISSITEIGRLGLAQEGLVSYGSFLYYFVANTGFAGFVTLPLVYGLLSGFKHLDRHFIARLAPVVLIIIIIAAGGVKKAEFLEAVDYRRYLADEAMIDLASKDHANTVMVLGEAGIAPMIVKSVSPWTIERPSPVEPGRGGIWNLKAIYDQSGDDLGSFVSSGMPCTDLNISQLENYGRAVLAPKGYRSVLAVDLFQTLDHCYQSNWDLEKDQAVNRQAFETRGMLINGLKYIGNRTSGAVYDRQLLSELRVLVNSGRYHIGAGARRSIAKKFARYGEIEEAKRWWPESTAMPEKLFNPSELRDGTIGGEIRLANICPGDVRVGLLVETKEDGELWYGLPVEGLKGLRLVAASGLDENARFRIDGLMGGAYEIGILIKGHAIAAEDLTSSHAFSGFVLDEKHPSLDLGVIELRAQ